jgi:predicted nucleotidyltransferase
VRVTGPGQPVHLLLDTIDHLNQLEIPYAVIGALAVSFYGIPRSTNDADTVIWLRHTGKTAQSLEKSLVAAGYTPKVTSGDIEDPISGVVVIEDIHGNRMDLWLGIHGMQPEAARRVRTTNLIGTDVQIVGGEDLIAMKLFAGGVQDLEDVKGIIQVSREQLDFELLKSVVSHYGKGMPQQLEKIINDTLH